MFWPLVWWQGRIDPSPCPRLGQPNFDPPSHTIQLRPPSGFFFARLKEGLLKAGLKLAIGDR